MLAFPLLFHVYTSLLHMHHTAKIKMYKVLHRKLIVFMAGISMAVSDNTQLNISFVEKISPTPHPVILLILSRSSNPGHVFDRVCLALSWPLMARVYNCMHTQVSRIFGDMIARLIYLF